jgi:DNA-binding transcriptional LysR family regulator
MEAFLAVVHNNSITKAANSLYLTQSTVSNRLHALEEELGLTLFERRQGMRSVELTPKGEELVVIAEKWISLWKETQQIKNSHLSVDIAIGSPDSLNICVLIPFYKQLADDPTINLRVRTQQSEEVYSLVDTRKVDIGFSFRFMQYHNVAVFPVFRDPLCLVCKRGGRFAPDESIHPSQLKTENELYLVWNQEFSQWHERWWAVLEKPHAFVDTPALIASLMDELEHWAVCPTSVSRFLISLGDFQVNPLSVPAPPRTCYFLQHQFPPSQKIETLKKVRSLFERYCISVGFSLISETPNT